MAVDGNTIVTLHKKCESNSCIAKKLHIRRETVWKVVKKFKETGETYNRPGHGRKRTVRTKRLVKNTRGKLKRNSRRSAVKMAAEAGISQTSMRRIFREILRNYLYKMQKRHELSITHAWTYETWQMSTHSESHERRYGAQFGVHWWEEIWRSAMPKPPKW